MCEFRWLYSEKVSSSRISMTIIHAADSHWFFGVAKSAHVETHANASHPLSPDGDLRSDTSMTFRTSEDTSSALVDTLTVLTAKGKSVLRKSRASTGSKLGPTIAKS